MDISSSERTILHKSQADISWIKFALFSAVVSLFLACYASAVPQIIFQEPTLADNSVTGADLIFINVTSSEDLSQSLLEWGNATGFTNVSMHNFSMTNWYLNMTDLTDGTYNYTIFAKNSTGDWNQTQRRWISVDTTQPYIDFIPPSDSDNAVVSRNWSYVNSSASDATNITALIDFNRSLVGWWRFNREAGENDTFVRDWSTYGNNGTIYNTNPGIENCTGNCSGWTSSGKFGNALQFDGVDDYVSGAISQNHDVFTITAWIKMSATSREQHFAEFGNTQFYVGSNNKLGTSAWSTASGSKTLSKNVWYFAALVRNNTNVSLYLDGEKDGNGGTRGTNPTNSFFIGDIYTLTGNYNFNGTIDEVHVWNRALNPEEINASYNAGLYRLYHNFTNLTDGTYTYTAYAQDAAGNVNQTETRTLKIDTTTPSYSLNNTNSTYAGRDTLFSLYWTDNALSSYIFSFDNGTGVYVNESGTLSGTSNYTNITKHINATTGSIIRWLVYVNDTASNTNLSGTYSFTTTEAPSLIITMSLANNTLNPDDSAYLSGHASYMNGTNVTGIIIDIYLDGERIDGWVDEEFIWWDYSWMYKDKVIINGSTGNLSDYSVSMTVNWTLGMNTSFDDLRFTYHNKTTNTELDIPYWIEKKYNGINATVWIRTDLTEGNNTINIYYGNPGSESKSDGASVFDLLEDWETGTVNTYRWTSGGSTSPYWITYTSTSYDGIYSSGNNDISDSQLSWTKRTVSVSSQSLLEFYWKVSSESGYDYLYYCIDNDECTYSSGYISRIAGSVDWTKVNYTLTPGQHSIKFVYRKDGSASAGLDTGWIDAIKIRKYTVPEPAILSYELYNRTHWINATGGYSSVFKVPTNAGTHALRVNSTDHNGITGENTTEFTSRIYIATDIHTVSKGARYAAPDDEINISGMVYRSLNGDIDSVWVNITDPDNQSKLYYLDNITAKNETGTWYKIINVSTEFSNTLGTYNSTFYANDTTGMVSSTPARSFWFTVQTGTIDMNLDYSVLVPFQTMKVSGQSVAAQKTVYIIMNDTYNNAATTQLNDTSSAKNVTLNASQSRTEYIRLPKYADITSVSFDIKGYAYNNSYPRNPSVDIGADNDNEFWGTGTYNGTLFLQDRFSDNLQLHNISFYLPDYDISYIRLPKYLSVYNATLNISGNTGPGFSDNGSYNKMQNGDLENGTTWWSFFTAHRDTNATGIVKEGNYSAHVTSTLGSYSALWYPESSFKSSVRNKKKFYTMWYYPVDLTADYIDLPSITQSQTSGPQLCYFMPRNTTGNLYSKGGSSVSFKNPMNTSKWYKIQLFCNPTVSEAILWIDDVKIARATGPSYTESYVGIWLADPWVGNAGWGNAYLDGMFLSVDDAIFTPENITLNIGNDSDIELNITSVFNSSNSPQKIEFRDEIISNIDYCTASVDSKGNVYCDVPINVTSQSAGNVALTVLNLTYNYSSSTFSSMLLDYKTAINKYLSSCTSDQSGYCNVPIVFGSDSQGALEISNINITYIADYLGKTETEADGAYSTYINAPKYPNQYNVSVFLFDSGVSLGSNMTNITVVADTSLTVISITTPIDADAGKLLWSDYQQSWDGVDVNKTTSSLTISLWNSTGYLVVDNASMSYNSTNSRWEYNYNQTYLGLMNFTVYANSWESVNGQPVINQSASSYFDAQNISISIDADKTTYNPEENITITGIALLQPYLRNVSSNTIYIYLDETKLLYKTETGYIESGGTSNLATDGNGSYSYILKSPLESGTYTLKINITNSNGTYGVNSTQFMTQISVKNKKAISPQTLTSHANKNQMINISSTIYRNIDNPIQTVWINVTLPDSTAYTYYLDNTTSRALTGTWFKSLNVSLEFGDLLGLYNITFYANSTLSDGSAISQQLPAPETSFHIDSMQTNLNLNRQPQIYGNGRNMTVSGNIVLNTDDGNQSNHVILIHVNNTMIGWCDGSDDPCISGNGHYIPAFGGTWKYVKRITIDNAGNPYSLYNYQVPVNITYNANMQADFDDIRFAWYNYSSRQYLKIPYFVENKTDSYWAYLWMKIPYMPADSTTNIYMYYGNDTAINESDENATFISGEIEPLIYNTKTSWSTSYDPYNVINHDTRAQSIYSFTDFVDAKLVPVKITKLVYPVYQTPGQSLTNYRIRMQRTNIIQNTGNFNTSNWTVSWGPTTHAITGGTSYNYTLSSTFYWTKDNLLIDLSRDGTSYTGNGGMYVRTDGLTARTCSYTSDSSRTWPFDGTCTNIDYVPVVVFSGLLRNYSAPEPTVISVGPEQPALMTDATGNYNYTVRPGVTDGIYTIKVNITDINGIYSENETSFEIDNMQPEMSISSPDNERTHYNYAPEIIGICTDKNNVSHIWTNITQYNTSQISAFNLTNISALSEQAYDVNITCNDTLGNEVSTITWFTYDATAPRVSLSNPLNNYNTSSPIISFTFNVTDNLNASMECSLYINGTLTATNDTTANATETAFQNMAVSPSLNQNWTVSCTDGINTNAPGERTFNIDNLIPTSNTPDDASYPRETPATINWTLYDNHAGGYYTIYRNNTLQNISAWTNKTDLNIWVNTSTIAIWNYTIVYNDSIGNIGTQDEVIITIISSDMTPPAVTIHSPSNTTYSTDPELNFTYTEAEPEKCWYSLNSGSNQTLASCSSNSTTLTSVYGSNNVILYMNDTTGNMNSTQKYWTYDNLGPNYTNNITSEESPATYSPSLSIQFNITVTDQYSPIDTVFLEFNGTNYTTTDITSNYTRTLPGIPVGTYNYRWHMNDTLGNMNTTPALTYTINKAATTLILLLNGNDADQAYYAPASVNATYISDNNESTISMYRNGSMLTLSGATNISQYQSDATYNYTITAYESQNYTSASSSHILTLFATQAPNITGWQNNITNNQYLTITINETQSIFFNITSTQPVNYAWSLDSIDQSQNIPNFTYADTEPGTHSIKVNISNINDTDELTWTLMVKDIPDINYVQESIDPVSLGSIIAIEANITDKDGDLSDKYAVIDGAWYDMQPNGQDRYLANFTPSTEKIYTYYIYANDTTGLSSNTTTYTFTSEQDPTINDVSVNPSSGNESTNFVIQANITDIISISTAYARFTQPEVFEIALANISDIYNTTYTSTTPGEYIFYIWSNDTLGASSSSASHNFTISDTTPPNISAVTITPPSKNETTVVTITASVTDYNLTSVYVTITGPANSTRTLNSVGDSQYSNTAGNMPHKPGIYTVETTATDAYGNNAAIQTNYRINDTQAPELDSLTIIPAIGNLDTNFTIFADITDNGAVNSTIANITKPDSVSDAVLLSCTNPYTATFSNTTLLGLYTLYIISNDSAGNILYSFGYPLGTANFSIADAQPPSINELNATPLSINTTDTITINANVTDYNGVNFVTAEVTRPDLYSIPISTFTNISEIYTANYTETTIPGRYTIRFNATDIAGNTSTATSNFTAADTITPQIKHISIDDITPSVSQKITFTSTSSDNDIINKLNGRINITKPDNTSSIIPVAETGSFNQGSPPTSVAIQYEANYTPTIVGKYTAILTMTDLANNTAHSVITFEAFDTAGPSISSVSIEAAETENITINMTADEESNYTFAYDAGSGWNYATNGSLRLNHTITLPKYNSNTTILYYINLTDQYGNSGRYPSIGINNFTVDGTLLFNQSTIELYLTEKNSIAIQVELRNPSSIPINATINKTKSWTTVPSAKYLNPLQSATINIILTPDDNAVGDWQATEIITAHGSALTTFSITMNIAHAIGDGECDTGEPCGTADCPACPASSSGSGGSSSGGRGRGGLPPLKHECESNANCTAAKFCKNYRCTDVRCSSCEYIKDHICAKYECCKDADCIIGYTCKNNICQKAEEPKSDNIEDALKIESQKAILRATKTVIANKLSRDTKKAEAILNEAKSAFAGVNYGQAKELADQAKLLAENAPLLEEKTPKEDTNRLFKAAMIILTIVLILVFIKKDLTNRAKAKYKSKDAHRFQRLNR